LSREARKEKHEETILVSPARREIVFTEAECNFLMKLVRDHVKEHMGGPYERDVCLSSLLKLGGSVFGGFPEGEERNKDPKIKLRVAVVAGED